MKQCEKFRELLTTHRNLKCDPDYTLPFVKCQKLKRLEATGFIFNNVLYFKSLLYYQLCPVSNKYDIYKVQYFPLKYSGVEV